MRQLRRSAETDLRWQKNGPVQSHEGQGLGLAQQKPALGEKDPFAFEHLGEFRLPWARGLPGTGSTV